MPRIAAAAFALGLAGCAAAPPPEPLGAREAAYFRAAQAQAERIAALSDAEVAAELSRPPGAPPARPKPPALDSHEHWIAFLRCDEHETVAARGECYAGAIQLHEAASRLLRRQAAWKASRA